MSQTTDTQRVTHQLIQIVPLIMQIVAAEVRRSENAVAPAHFRLLNILDRCPSSLSELAERQDVSLPTISNSINTLVERGWVTRKSARSDRRVAIAELTPLGLRVLNDIRSRALTRLQEMLCRLSPDDLDRLVVAFEILENILLEDVRSRFEYMDDITS
jgi:DNA-binding MarR family transcriptional regulator